MVTHIIRLLRTFSIKVGQDLEALISGLTFTKLNMTIKFAEKLNNFHSPVGEDEDRLNKKQNANVIEQGLRKRFHYVLLFVLLNFQVKRFSPHFQNGNE